MDDREEDDTHVSGMTIKLIITTTAVSLTVIFLLCRRFSKRRKQIPGLKASDDTNGNLSDISAAGSLHEFLVKLHGRFGPIASFWWKKHYTVSIHKPEHFKQTITMFDKPPELVEMFESLFGKDCITCKNGKDGQALFKEYARCFTEKAIRPFFPSINQIAKETVDDLVGTPPDLYLSVIDTAFIMSIHTMLKFAFGEIFVPGDNTKEKIKQVKRDYEYVMREMERRIGQTIPEQGSEQQRTFDLHLANLKAVAKEAVDLRRANPAPDGEELFVDMLLEQHQDNENVMQDNAISFFVGGFHTSGLLVVWALYYIAENPEVQEYLREEILQVVPGDCPVGPDDLDQMTYLTQVLDETLRCSVLAPYATRLAQEDMTIGGYHVPKGTFVFQSLGVSLWDEERWSDARRFDPERFDPANRRKIPSCGFEPFGFAGKRKCPAYRLGYIEASIFLAHLLRRTRIKLAPDQEVEYKHGLVTSPRNEIWFLLETI